MTLQTAIVTLFSLGMLGAWMWARPTAWDKRRSAIRNAAMQEGLGLTTLSVPDFSVDGRVRGLTRLVTAYRLRDQASGVPRFLVLRTSGENGRGLPEGWQWQSPQDRALNAAGAAVLAEYLLALPEWIEAVGCTQAGWVVVFDERDPAQLSGIRDCLETLRGLAPALSS